MSDAFKNAVDNALQRGAPLDHFVAILIEFRDKGMSADSALSTLRLLRADAGEEVEDRILEIMDIASGYCAPDLRVWKE